jgi:hypothetical protein
MNVPGAQPTKVILSFCIKHVPLEEFKANMKHIVQHIKKTYNNKTKIVLVAPGPFFPVNEDAGKRSTNEIHRQYAQACVDVANEEVCGKHELHDYNTTCNWIGK